MSGELLVPPALQARSRATQDRIFAAGTRLLEDDGVEALTVAGVSVGSIYRRFGDKERLLSAIQVRFTQDFRAEFEARVTGAPLSDDAAPADLVAAAVTGMANTYRAHAPLLRVFILLGMRQAAVLEQGTREAVEGGRSFRRALEAVVPHIRRDDAEAAIDYAYLFVDSVCSHRVIRGEGDGGPRPAPWDELIDHVATSINLFLLGSID
jgi:AcrR family transcriptional regulator